MRPDAINPGDVIGGKYRVRAVLGRTRGLLVEAWHTELDQRVAIRVLSPALLGEKEVGLFRREARLLAKLESEPAARIVDVGTLPDGTFYFAREYLEVAERLGGSPQLKLVDFGTAKLMRSATAPTAGGEMTATAVCGLSCYASPELIRKTSHLDVRADIWSLGAIFYLMLAGHPPFEGDLAPLILEITREDPVSMTHWRSDTPAEIDAVIRRALAKDVDARFVNVHDFAHALAPFASAEGQILIRRIGEITAAGKRRRAKGAPGRSPAVDRDPPSATTALATDHDLQTIQMHPLEVGHLLGARPGRGVAERGACPPNVASDGESSAGRPTTGAAKSRSIAVEGGKTALALFKL